MPDVGLHDPDIGAAPEKAGQLVLQFHRIEPVRGDPDNRDRGLHGLQRRRDPPAVTADVVMVHGLAQHDVRIGVEASQQLSP